MAPLSSVQGTTVTDTADRPPAWRLDAWTRHGHTETPGPASTPPRAPLDAWTRHGHTETPGPASTPPRAPLDAWTRHGRTETPGPASTPPACRQRTGHGRPWTPTPTAAGPGAADRAPTVDASMLTVQSNGRSTSEGALTLPRIGRPPAPSTPGRAGAGARMCGRARQVAVLQNCGLFRAARVKSADRKIVGFSAPRAPQVSDMKNCGLVRLARNYTNS
ncbi:hypothetical protein SEA_REYNAULD_97 [Rhodococcus phage Reynauld]|uniref:Uncharacterized protein n=1 Tax=Rhodococcus phage Reynauld TaxID=3062845 RepID=A0ACD4UHP8_9CAUD|nr:hypothetical protein SEA_REYNAULD_97 [Rhodococcus phage Reynauld]